MDRVSRTPFAPLGFGPRSLGRDQRVRIGSESTCTSVHVSTIRCCRPPRRTRDSGNASRNGPKSTPQIGVCGSISSEREHGDRRGPNSRRRAMSASRGRRGTESCLRFPVEFSWSPFGADTANRGISYRLCRVSKSAPPVRRVGGLQVSVLLYTLVRPAV